MGFLPERGAAEAAEEESIVIVFRYVKSQKSQVIISTFF